MEFSLIHAVTIFLPAIYILILPKCSLGSRNNSIRRVSKRQRSSRKSERKSEQNKGGNDEKNEGNEKQGSSDSMKKKSPDVMVDVTKNNENVQNDDSKKVLKEQGDVEDIPAEHEECLEETQAQPECVERAEAVDDQDIERTAMTPMDDTMERTAAARDEGGNKSVKSKKKDLSRSRKHKNAFQEAISKPSEDELYIDDPYMYNEKLRGGNSLLALDLNAKNQIAIAMQEKTQCSLVADKSGKKKEAAASGSEKRKKKSGSQEVTKTQCSTIIDKEPTKDENSRKKKRDTDRKAGASTKKLKGREDAGRSSRRTLKSVFLSAGRKWRKHDPSEMENGSGSYSDTERQSTRVKEHSDIRGRQNYSDSDESESSISNEEESSSNSLMASIKLSSINEPDTSKSSLSKKLHSSSKKKRFTAGFNLIKWEKAPGKKGLTKDAVAKKALKKSDDVDEKNALKELKALNNEDKRGSKSESVLLQRMGLVNDKELLKAGKVDEPPAEEPKKNKKPNDDAKANNKGDNKGDVAKKVEKDNKGVNEPAHKGKAEGGKDGDKSESLVRPEKLVPVQKPTRSNDSVYLENKKVEQQRKPTRGTAKKKSAEKVTALLTAKAIDTEGKDKDKGNKGASKKPEKPAVGMNNLLNVAQWIYGSKPSSNAAKIKKPTSAAPAADKNPKKSK